jgi:hypothetical protein
MAEFFQMGEQEGLLDLCGQAIQGRYPSATQGFQLQLFFQLEDKPLLAGWRVLQVGVLEALAAMTMGNQSACDGRQKGPPPGFHLLTGVDALTKVSLSGCYGGKGVVQFAPQ